MKNIALILLLTLSCGGENPGTSLKYKEGNILAWIPENWEYSYEHGRIVSMDPHDGIFLLYIPLMARKFIPAVKEAKVEIQKFLTRLNDSEEVTRSPLEKMDSILIRSTGKLAGLNVIIEARVITPGANSFTVVINIIKKQVYEDYRETLEEIFTRLTPITQ